MDSVSVGDAITMSDSGTRVVGLCSSVLGNSSLLQQRFDPVLHAALLRRSPMCAVAEALGDIAVENVALTALGGAGVQNRAFCFKLQHRVPPGLATRFTRALASLIACLERTDAPTNADVLAAMLPLVARAYSSLV